MLHLAYKLAAPSHLKRVSGAAVQFQREPMWFKAVDKLVEPSEHDAELSELTPRSLFTREHEQRQRAHEEYQQFYLWDCVCSSFQGYSWWRPSTWNIMKAQILLVAGSGSIVFV